MAEDKIGSPPCGGLHIKKVFNLREQCGWSVRASCRLRKTQTNTSLEHIILLEEKTLQGHCALLAAATSLTNTNLLFRSWGGGLMHIYSIATRKCSSLPSKVMIIYASSWPPPFAWESNWGRLLVVAIPLARRRSNIDTVQSLTAHTITTFSKSLLGYYD